MNTDVMPDRLALMSEYDLEDAVLAEDPPCLLDSELHDGPDDPDTEPLAEWAARVAVAREVCAACPARLVCLAHALRTRPAAGVWAGLTAEEIAALAAQSAHADPAEMAA